MAGSAALLAVAADRSVNAAGCSARMPHFLPTALLLIRLVR
jgi:hypothetical protein